jgi:hypothetical protein
MRYFFIFFLILTNIVKAQIISAPHCGYDFTSYLVVNVHEKGKQDNIKNLRITIVDSTGNEVINKNNRWSWVNNNQPLLFTPNYKLNKAGVKVPNEHPDAKWFFPFAKDNYLLSVVNTFLPERFSIKIEDIDGEENDGWFETEIIQLYPFNMYILCSSENERQAPQFGPRTNRQIEVIVEKIKNR